MTEMTHKWEPITQGMLELFELEGSGECLLLSTKGYKYIDTYEWQAGLRPHGFTLDDGRWDFADRFTAIMRNI
jgi:hypothetical protein